MTKFSIRKGLFNDKFVLILSFVLAILLWLVVSISVSPTIIKDVSNVPVTISLDNSSFKGLRAFGTENYNVQVKVQGKKYITDSINADDIIVTANVGQIVGTGVNTLELSAKSIGKNDFDIVSLSPSAVVVYLDYPAEKTLDLDIEYKGATVSNDKYLLEANVGEAYKQVVISGAQNEVQKVSRAVSVAEVNKNLESSEIFNSKIKLYDNTGAVISPEYSTLNFNNVDITVSVQEQITLPLSVKTINGPEKLPEIKIYRVLNNTKTEIRDIVVKGEPSLVESLENIELGSISFSSFSTDVKEYSFDFNLPTIGGISYPTISSPSDEKFTVIVDNSNVFGKTFDIEKSSIKIIGLNDNNTAVVQTSKLQGIAVLSTSNAQLNKLKSSDITAYVDASSLEKGSHSCNKISFSIEGFPNCWVVIPQGAIEVAIKIE